jgi:hypothetical protein
LSILNILYYLQILKFILTFCLQKSLPRFAKRWQNHSKAVAKTQARGKNYGKIVGNLAKSPPIWQNVAKTFVDYQGVRVVFAILPRFLKYKGIEGGVVPPWIGIKMFYK